MLKNRLKNNEKGQNIIEFSLLMAIVMAAIIMMGPYIIRSWNANMKGWQDSVEDSYSESPVDYEKSIIDDIYISADRLPPARPL